MPRDAVTIQGSPAFRRMMRGAPKAIEKAFGARVVVPVTLKVEELSKKEAPVRTGALRADIHHRFPSDTEGQVRSGDAIAYAVPVHEGHRTASGSTVAGNPYLVRGAKGAEPFARRKVKAFERDLPGILRRL